MDTLINREEVRAAYEDVRSDGSETAWAVFKYDEDNKITTNSTGTEYEAMLETFGDDERVFAYARFTTGDEMSKRAKFALITWIGPTVGAMKKAKVSTDKTFVKQVMPEYGKEFLADDKSDLEKDLILTELEKSSGANYGKGDQ